MGFRIGTDIVEIERIASSVQTFGDRFVHRILSQDERAQYGSRRGPSALAFLAGRFCAKEAVFKALGQGVRFTDIEIVPSDSGAPVTTLVGEARAVAAALRVKHLQVSISHGRTIAHAVALLETEA